jgi:hypothetical protein
MTDPTPAQKRSPLEHDRDAVSPEAVERLARPLERRKERVHDLSGVSYVPDQECAEAADALRALSAERDALRAENKRLRESLRGWIAVAKQQGIPVCESDVALTQETDR